MQELVIDRRFRCPARSGNVVVAWPLGGEGRRLFAGTALFRGVEPLAWAGAVWVVVGDEARDPVLSRA